MKKMKHLFNVGRPVSFLQNNGETYFPKREQVWSDSPHRDWDHADDCDCHAVSCPGSCKYRNCGSVCEDALFSGNCPKL